MRFILTFSLYLGVLCFTTVGFSEHERSGQGQFSVGRSGELLGVFSVLSKRDVSSFEISDSLIFTSKPMLNGELPTGWIMPIIDSCAYQDHERGKMALLPSGEVVTLDEELGDNSQWTWTTQENFLMLANDRVKATFKDGRILNYSIDGRLLTWVRSRDGKVKQVDASNGGNILTFKYEQFGVDQEIVIRATKSGDEAIVSAINPKFVPSVANISAMPSVNSIEANGIIYRIQQNPSDELTELIIENSDGSFSSHVWSARNGDVLSVDGLVYRVVRTEREGFDLVEPRIDRLDNQHTQPGDYVTVQEGTYYSVARALNIIETSPSHWRKERLMIGDFGTRIGSIEYYSGNTITSRYKASFDEGGVPIRESIGDYERRFRDGLFYVYKNGKLIRTY